MLGNESNVDERIKKNYIADVLKAVRKDLMKCGLVLRGGEDSTSVLDEPDVMKLIEARHNNKQPGFRALLQHLQFKKASDEASASGTSSCGQSCAASSYAGSFLSQAEEIATYGKKKFYSPTRKGSR